MSIASQIEDYADGLSDAYAIVAQRGGTIPAQKNMANLDTAIATIPSGGGQFIGIPREVINNRYTVSGTVTTFSLPSGITVIDSGALAFAFAKFSNNTPMPALTTFSVPSGTIAANPYTFYYTFYGNDNLRNVDLGGINTAWGYTFYGAFQNCTSLTDIDFGGITSISGTYALSNACQGCSALETIDLSGLTTVNQNYACQNICYNCYNLKSVDLSSLTTVSGTSAFQNAFTTANSPGNIQTSISMPELVTVSGTSAFQSAFGNCKTATTINMPKLKTVSGGNAFTSAFYGLTNVSSINFPVLSSVTGSACFNTAFGLCTGLTSLSFPALTQNSFGSYSNQFNNMLLYCTGVTVHFPAAVKTKIQNWSSVTSGFGGTNTTVLYDL